MVPALTAGGQSFKGAALYYLHDKRGNNEAERLTADRVTWTATVNLPTDDPERAWRMMAHTAMAQAELKAASGKKATGRKLTRPVLAYSLAWHPDERPTRAEQIDAARASLKTLGLEEHQALIVCHDDEPHAHVHILVNRVHPVTGIAATLSNSKLKLSQWAQAYEEARGPLLCRQRAANNARRRQGETVRDASRLYRPAFEFKRAVGNDDLSAAFTRTAQVQKDAHLHDLGRTLKRSHARQWAELKRVYADGREKIEAYAEQTRAQKAAEARNTVHPARPVDAVQIIYDLTAQHSTFSRADLQRHAERQAATAAEAKAMVEAILNAPELVTLGADGQGRTRYTARDLQAIERGMLADVMALHGHAGHGTGIAAQDKALRGLPFTMDADQLAAFRHVTGAGDLTAVIGYAGSGKSTMLRAARAAWTAEGYRVRGAALSGVAADGLRDGAAIDSDTIHALLFRLDKGTDRLTAHDVLVVDEAGMIGSRLLARLLVHARAAGAKLVLVGDPEQLQAIEAGGAFRAVTDRVGAAAMTTIRRQRETWQQEATRDLAGENVAGALRRYEAAGMVHHHDSQDAAKAALVAAWNAHRCARPDETQIMLAYRRIDVQALNEQARALRRAAGELGPDHVLDTAQGQRAFAAGDRVCFLKNDRRLGVRNGSLGTVLRIEGDRLTVRLDSGKTVEFSAAAYGSIDHGYAATVHKSQGVTVDRAHVLASRLMDKHAAYVALTRHQDRVDLHWSGEEFGNRAALTRALGRRRMKDTGLDYDEASRERPAAAAARAFRPTPNDVDRQDSQTRAALARLRKQFLDQCAALRQTQAEERAALKAAWKTRNAERRLALRPYLGRQHRGQGHSVHTARHLRDGKGPAWPPKPAGPSFE